MRRCAAASPRRASDVEIAYAQRVLLDEFAARLDHVAHQRREDLIGADRILDADLQQTSGIRIDGGFPQLLRIHFAEALEARDRAAALGLFHEPRVRLREIADALALAAA